MRNCREALESELGREHQLESVLLERRSYWENFLSKHALQLERGGAHLDVI